MKVSLHYLVNATDQLVTITGDYSSAEEWAAMIEQIQRDTRLRPGFAFLRDLRSATTPVDVATVVTIMDAVRRAWPIVKPSRGAILTPHSFDVAALAAHALADSHGLAIRMFTNYEAAIEWLRAGTVKTETSPDAQQ